MVAPAAAAAAGWTIGEVASLVGIAGTVGGGVGQASASGGSGFNYSGPSGNIHFPAEIGPALFLGDGHQAGGTLARFFADGYIWNNECFIRYHGLFSHSNEPAMCYMNGNNPEIPANRWLEVGFQKGGEELDKGLLNVGLSTYSSGVAGDKNNPGVIIHLGGHFDPVGSGDAEFGFNVILDTYGQVTLADIQICTGGLSISQAGNQIDLKLDQ